MQAIKAFFGKVWAWVLANKVLAGVIAGVATLAIVTAIVVPVSVSSAKKKKAAEQEQQQSGEVVPYDDGGKKGDQGGGGDSTPAHTHVDGDLVPALAPTCETNGHAAYYYCEACQKYFDENKVETTLQALTVAATGHDYQFDSFVWTTTPGAYTAKAKYVCSHNAEHIELHDAVVSKIAAQHVDPSGEVEGLDVWHASYEGNEANQNEVLAAIGHNYGQPEWSWVDNDSATATFTCANDAGHTETIPAQIQENPSLAPTCTNSGISDFVATVQFGGQTYTDTHENVSIPATGHSINAHQFCPDCLTYFGETATLDNPLSLADASRGGEIFFRFEYEDDEHYFLGGNGDWVSHELLSANYYYINMQLQFVKIDTFDITYDNTADWIPVYISEYMEGITALDSYIYVEYEVDNALELDTASIELQNCHSSPDAYGYCRGGDFTGIPGIFAQSMDTGPITTTSVQWVEYDALPDHTYLLDLEDGWTASEAKIWYYDEEFGAYQEISKRFEGGLYYFDTPTVGKFCEANETEGKFVVVLTASGLGTNPTSSILVNEYWHLKADQYGFCVYHPDEYTGYEIDVDDTEIGIDVAADEKAYYKFQLAEGHSFTFGDPSGEINRTCLSAATRSLTGVMTPVTLTHTTGSYQDTPVFTSLDGTDGFLYITITPKEADPIHNGEIEVIENHPLVGGECPLCNSAAFTLLTKDVESAEFNVPAGGCELFRYVYTGAAHNFISIACNLDYSVLPEPSMYFFIDGVLTEVEYSGSASMQDDAYYEIPDELEPGDTVYIQFDNNTASDSNGWKLTVTESDW